MIDSRFRLGLIGVVGCAVAVAAWGQPADSTDAPSPSAARPAEQADASQLLVITRAMRALERGEAEEALNRLTPWLEEAEPGLPRHIGQLIKGQLDGSLKQRQSRWLSKTPLDVVVLVPDEASFLSALRYWTDDVFFPVLIEDAWYAPLFIQAYQPTRVVRWSVETDQVPTPQRLVLEAISEQSEKLTSRPATTPPPGMVVVDPGSNERVGGVALALGRDQPMVRLVTDLKYHEVIDPAEVADYNDILMPHAARWRMIREDQWFGMTLAGNYPYRYRDTEQAGHTLAVDDLLGRDSRGLRLGVVGRLLGDPVHSVYQAMASLFLVPRRMLLFDDYSNRANTFTLYQLDQAARLLSEPFHVQLVRGQRVRAPEFRKLTRGDDPFDLFWVHSSGGSRNWSLQGGNGMVDDIPIGHAYAWYMIHSHSAAYPHQDDTIAGRALAGGAYWYFGAIHEPYLHAFALPTGMAAKIARGTPLAFAARQIPGHPMYKPWKLMTIGDPLFVLRPQPPARNNDLPLEDTTTVRFAASNQTEPGQRLRDALFDRATGFGRSPDSQAMREVVKALVQGIKQPEQLSPDELARTTWWLDQLDKPLVGADVDPQLAMKHPIARVMVWRAARVRFDQLFRTDGPVEAREYLKPMLILAADVAMVQGRTERWLAEMAKQERRAEAEAYLNQLLDGKPPYPARRAIERALKSLPANEPDVPPNDQPSTQ